MQGQDLNVLSGIALRELLIELRLKNRDYDTLVLRHARLEKKYEQLKQRQDGSNVQ